MRPPVDRRAFLTGLGAAAAAACRRPAGGPIVLRLSHSMAPGPTSLHLFADAFKDLAEKATGGAVTVRVFPSGTLGQEREVVQQLQEGLVDFMVSGTAIWGSVAPKLQVFDFPFMWDDYDHVHRVVDGAIGREAADYLEGAVRMRPLAWGDSFGFRHVITRSREVTDTRQLAGLKIRTIQASIYVKAIELMGASPTPMAFGEVYTSLQTGVIDGYEHDASTTLQQRFHEVARFMARTGHIAGVLGIWASADRWHGCRRTCARHSGGRRPRPPCSSARWARRRTASRPASSSARAWSSTTWTTGRCSRRPSACGTRRRGRWVSRRGSRRSAFDGIAGPLPRRRR